MAKKNVKKDPLTQKPAFDLVTGMPIEEEQKPETIMCPAEAVEGFERDYTEPPLRELPKGMNKFNSTNEFLMLILESLYRIERKMGV
jgi:hypothetical protein